MKITDIVGVQVVVYDSNLERLALFYRWAEKRGYICRIEDNCNNAISRPCVYLASNHIIYTWAIDEAIKRNFIIVPTLAIDDFAEYERWHQREQAKKVKQIINKIFPKADIEQKSVE